MADPCGYDRCTGRITKPDQAATLTLPGEAPRHFCSVTCQWSWLQEHVAGKAAEAQTALPVPSPVPPPRKPRQRATPNAPAVKPSQFPSARVTQPIQTFAPGEYQWEQLPIIPDEDVKRQITAILRTSIDGPHRFAWHALIPYIRVGPSDAQTAITVRATPRLHLMAAQARTLQGAQDTMDLAIEFEGLNGQVHLRDVLTLPGKELLAKTALDSYERKSLGKGR